MCMWKGKGGNKKKVALSLLKFSLTFASLTPLTCLFSTYFCIQQQQQWAWKTARRKMSWKLRKISSLFFIYCHYSLFLSFNFIVCKKRWKIFFFRSFYVHMANGKNIKLKLHIFLSYTHLNELLEGIFLSHSLSLYELSIFSIRKWY